MATITLTSGTAGAGYAFGELPPSSLSGTVYRDLDNNGAIDGGEMGVDGATVALTGTDDLGGIVNLSTTTAGGGLYSFTNLRPGTYTITETQPAGLLDGIDTQGTPGGGTAINDAFQNITLVANTDGADNNFGELPPSSLSGTVYRDNNNDGLISGGETGIGNVSVFLSGLDDLGNAVNLSTTTLVDGTYSFTNLRPSGVAGYTITETQPAGFLDGTDTSGTSGGIAGAVGTDNIGTIVLVSATSATDYNFGELNPALISGAVYGDFSTDGVFDAFETGIAGVNVTLTGTDDLGAITPITVTTGAGGMYSFTNLRPGTYALTETQPVDFSDGAETLGTGLSAPNNAGSVGADTFTGIAFSTVAAGNTDGVNYNFGEAPILDLSKSIVSTSVGGDTSANVVIGEVVRFRLVATVPNGVYSNFQLRDILPAGYQFLDNGNARAGLVSAGGELTATGLTAPLTSITTPNVALAGTAISTSATADEDTYFSGTDVFFKFGTLTNTDADSGTTQAVVIEFDALVVNELGNQSGATLDNSLSALFDKTNDGIPDDDALLPTPVTSTISEPFMALDKTAGSPNTNLQAGDTVTYTITFSNLSANGATAAAFDTLILDSLPAGILITSIDSVNFPMSVTQDAAVTITGGGTGLSGQFDIPIDATVTITYTGTLQTSVNPGASYDNTATLTFTSINGVDPNERTGIAPNIQGDGSVDDYRLVDTATVSTATTFVLDKTSPAGPFTIGDTVDYTLTLQLIEGTTPNVQIADALPAGLQFVPGSVVVTPGTGMSTDFVSEAASVSVVGQNVTLALGTVVNPAGGGNTITITFSVLVLDSAANDTTTAQGETKTNSATATGTGVPPSIDMRDVQVVEPRLIVTKAVDDTTPDINQVVNYTVSIEHAATSGSAAYDIRVRDLLPAGLDLDEATLAITSGTANIVTNVSAGNLLDFTLDQLGLGQSVTFTYQARVVNALTTVGTSQDNNVRLYWDTQAADEPTNVIFGGGTDGTPDRDFGATPGYTESSTPAPDDDAQDTVTLTVNTNSIAGTVYRDEDSSGTFTVGDTTLDTDVRLVGTTNSGLPVDITLTTVGGAYNFTNLPAGIYTLTETQPLGHTDGLETIGTAFGGPAVISDAVGSNTIADITIPTQGSTAATDYNFGETLASSLAGTVYRDFSNDGIVGGTEPGIGGVTVTLVGTDIYGVVVNEMLISAGDGTYLFNSIGGLAEGLRPGDYTITEVAGPALAPYFDGIDTVGTAGTALAGTAPEFDAIAVTLVQNTAGTGYTFGELDPASISGSAYADFNNDGVRDANEPGINNVSIRLQGTDDRANPVDITLVTDATGAYSFTGLRPGTYSVTETAQPGGYADGTDSIGTGLVGGLNDPGTAGNEVPFGIVIADVAPGNNAGVNYNFGELYNPEIAKSITATSEAFTGPVLGTERVALGEFVRYRIVVQAVDSAFTDFVIRDTLPLGMRPVEGPATIAIVSNGGLQSSFGFGGAQVIGNSSAVSPIVQIPLGNISSDIANTEDNYISGGSIYFHLGNVVNNDADADNEYFVIEFTAQVVNETGNQAGTTLSNTFDVLLDLDASGATADLEVAASLALPVDVVVAEANLAIGKTLVSSTTPTDAGDLVTYRITLTNNASGDNAAPAFDFRILDILDAISAGNAGIDLELIDTTLGSGITITAPGGTTLSANNSTTSQLDLVFDQLNAGESVTVDIVTRVITTAPAGSTLTNSVTADYTSLPGDGSSLTVSTDGGPIAISPAVGDERNGADIAAPTDNTGPANNAVLNNYAVGATIPIGDIRTTNTPTIDKQFGTTSEASTAGTNVAIGEIVTFNIVVTLPEGTTQGVILTDNMQEGFEFLGAALDFTGSGVVPFALPVPGITSGVGSGNQIVYTLGTLTNAADNNAANDSFTLIVTARVSDLAGNVSGVTRSNAADLQFTDPDGPTVVSVPDPMARPS